MPNAQNLKGQGFHTDPSRINRSGKKPGTKNRATILRELIAVTINSIRIDGSNGLISVEEAMLTGLLRKAMAGDVAAIREVQDSIHGKMVDSQVQVQAVCEINEAGTQALRHFIKNNPHFG